MDQEKFRKQPRAYKYENLDIDERSLHSNYKVELGPGEPTPTGRMIIFRLLPENNTGPRFEGRWDDRQEAVDIDVFEVSNAAVRRFKSGSAGYHGHHSAPVQFTSRGRSYDVRITWPDLGVVFDGSAIFSIHRVLPASPVQIRIVGGNAVAPNGTAACESESKGATSR